VPNIDRDLLPFGLNEDLLPKAVAKNAPLARHRPHNEIETDRSPAIRPQECLEEAESDKGHDVDVCPHRECCLHRLLRPQVIDLKICVVLSNRNDFANFIFSEDYVENCNTGLHSKENEFKAS